MRWALGDGGITHIGGTTDGRMEIETLEGTMRAEPGDWITREPFPTSGRRCYPCKPDIFEATYEPVAPGLDPQTVEAFRIGVISAVDYQKALALLPPDEQAAILEAVVASGIDLDALVNAELGLVGWGPE